MYSYTAREIRAIVPANELKAVVENIGLPEAVNLAWVDSVTVGPADGEMLIQSVRKSPHDIEEGWCRGCGNADGLEGRTKHLSARRERDLGQQPNRVAKTGIVVGEIKTRLSRM